MEKTGYKNIKIKKQFVPFLSHYEEYTETRSKQIKLTKERRRQNV